VRGAASNYSYYFIHNLPNYTDFLLGMARQSSDEALEMARVTRDEVDVLFLGDPTSICIPFNLVGTGFADVDTVRELLASGAIQPGGGLPVNTHGGNLSCAHPGTPGQMLHVIEAVRQLRGECGDRQVEGAKTALVHGQAGVFTSHCSVVLGTAP
jgi:acetyl-CoA acetyltransferase